MRNRSRPIRKDRLHTPDGRYFVKHGKLYRCANPDLSDAERRALIKRMMQGRIAMQKAVTSTEFEQAKSVVHAAKVALGERGPLWWDGDENDYSGFDPLNTPYADWWRSNS